MKLEEQVTSLELSKKLKELGVKQESLFFWSFYDDGNSKDNPGIAFVDNCNLSFMEDLVSAFTVAELDYHLMKSEWAVIAQHDSHWVFKQKRGTTLEYGMIGGHGMGPMNNPADRRASLLIILIEEELIKIQ